MNLNRYEQVKGVTMRSPPCFTTGQPLPTENPDVLNPIWTQSCLPEVTFEPPSPVWSLASDRSPPRILIITVVIWCSVWIFRWHKYLGTDSQRDRGDRTVQYLTSRHTAPHKIHPAPGQDFATWSQHSPLSPKGACEKRHFQREDATWATKMGEHTGFPPVKSVNSLDFLTSSG